MTTAPADPPWLAELAGGDRRSIGPADQVVARLRERPEGLDALLAAMQGGDPVLAMRAADVLEKLTRDRPALLAPFSERLLALAQESGQQEVCWHLAQMLPRLPLDGNGMRRALVPIRSWLARDSRILVTESLQAMTELALRQPALLLEVRDTLARHRRHPSPAVQARVRRLLPRIERALQLCA